MADGGGHTAAGAGVFGVWDGVRPAAAQLDRAFKVGCRDAVDGALLRRADAEKSVAARNGTGRMAQQRQWETADFVATALERVSLTKKVAKGGPGGTHVRARAGVAMLAKGGGGVGRGKRKKTTSMGSGGLRGVPPFVPVWQAAAALEAQRELGRRLDDYDVLRRAHEGALAKQASQRAMALMQSQRGAL